MADVSLDTINRLWAATKASSWESLRQGLEIIWTNQVIDRDTHDRLLWAINKLESLNIDFPLTASELLMRLNYYM